jgi:8-oxo-dGTP pyrophosphatase MutT (NUDIX family)
VRSYVKVEEDAVLKARRLIAAGGVAFRTANDGFEVALCLKKREKVWCLPKGLIEEGETVEEAALREVKEETGLDGEIIGRVGEIHYFLKGQRYFKTVHFYLIKYVGGSLRNHGDEVDEVQWFKLSEALRVLAYKKETKILKKAEKILENMGIKSSNT